MDDGIKTVTVTVEGLRVQRNVIQGVIMRKELVPSSGREEIRSLAWVSDRTYHAVANRGRLESEGR
jgi:hypothetical protein